MRKPRPNPCRWACPTSTRSATRTGIDQWPTAHAPLRLSELLPFGATGPVYGRYSWDYNVYFAAGLGYNTPSLPSFPYPMYYPASYYLQYPTYSYNWAWKGFGW